MRDLRSFLPVLPFILVLLTVGPTASAEDTPYPTGLSDQTHGGMGFSIALPSDYDATKEYSLLIALHGRGGTGTSLASGFSSLTSEGFVVCAPQSGSAQGWDQPNVDKAKKVLEHLIDVLSIDEKRLHGAAFSQACPLLSSIVFDRDFHFISACWSMGGCTGGKVPKWARKEMGVITLVGSEDFGYGSAAGTVKMLRKKVRSVECHVQKGLGHEFPIKLEPYYRHWLQVMNGRFVPGECRFLDWTDDVDVARAGMAEKKRGGFLYFYADDDTESSEARRVQNEVLFDPIVRHFGRQLVAIKLERKANAELFTALGLKTTPAVVALKPDFTAAKSFEGKKVTASSLAKALRGVARDKSMPKRPGVFIHE